jgi:tetratricopeptide (TPR) repeat protein
LQRISAEIEKNPEEVAFKKMRIRLYEASGDMDKAIAAAEKAMQMTKSNEVASFLELKNIKADLYFKIGEYEAAERLAQEVISQNPLSVEARFIIAKAKIQAGDALTAISSLRQLAFENPDKAFYQHYLGLAHRIRSESAQSEEAFSKALDIAPDYKDALMKLAEISTSKGSHDLLQTKIKKYLKMKPDDKDILTLLESVSEKKDPSL